MDKIIESNLNITTMYSAVTADMTVYEACKAMTANADTSSSQMDQFESILQCIGTSNAKSIDTFFLIYASSLVFFMQAGFAMLCAGK